MAKTLAVVLVILALAVLSEAQKTKVFTIKDTATVGSDANAKIGDTAVLVRTLAEGGKLYQSGIYVATGQDKSILNYQVTIVVENGGGDFPNGQIFAVGSGSGVQDSGVTLPKTIVGGTGAYANARGTLNSQGNKLTVSLF